jgi:hypothetical protein
MEPSSRRPDADQAKRKSGHDVTFTGMRHRGCNTPLLPIDVIGACRAKLASGRRWDALMGIVATTPVAIASGY